MNSQFPENGKARELYEFVVSDRALVGPDEMDGLVADALRRGGFNIGPMLWTQDASSYSARERWQFWEDAMRHAGIECIEQGYDMVQGHTWFRVWKKSDSTKKS